MVDPRLAVFKALGDNTRYAIYLELARSAGPLPTSDIAETLGLHPNTVRPHLERMREVGLLEVDTETPQGVGRPQHRYALAADAPSLGLEPPTFPILAEALVRACVDARLSPEDMADAARAQGRADGAVHRESQPDSSCVTALMAQATTLGFDPEVVSDAAGGVAVIAFARCPFRELAEAHPEVVCSVHRGLVEGMAEAMGDEIDEFHDLSHRQPCQVVLTGLEGATLSLRR